MGIIKRIFILIVTLIMLSGCGINAEEYEADLKDAADQMLEESEQVLSILDQYTSIWSFSIENRSAIGVNEVASFTGLSEDEVKEYFEINSMGNVTNDFSSNVHSVKGYFDDQIDGLEKNAKNIKEKVSELKDTPKDYEKSYDELLDLYDLYEKNNEMMHSPSGTLQEFNKDKNELQNEIKSKHKRIDVVIPN